MATTVLFDEQIEIPLDIQSLADFRGWALSEKFPETGRVDFVVGRIEVDMSPEDLYCHGALKVELIRVLSQLLKSEQLGDLFTDRARVSSPQANLSAEPDVVFVSYESLDTGRIRLVPKASGEPGRYVELEGGPDLIVEIAGDTSVRKDTERLPEAYFTAGVREYWLIDARRDPLAFQIHHRSPKGFIPAAADAAGYRHSPTFNRSFRLERSSNAAGRTVFDLHERESQ